MKNSLFGYNKREVDEEIARLNISCINLERENAQLKAQVSQITEQSFDSSIRLNELTVQLISCQKQLEQLNDSQDSDKVDVQEIIDLQTEIAKLERENAILQQKKVELENSSSTVDMSEVFAFAQDNTNRKNKDFYQRVKKYIDDLFETVTTYKAKAKDSFDSFNSVKTAQKDKIIAICEDTIRQLNELDQTLAISDEMFDDLGETEEKIKEDVDRVLGVVNENTNADSVFDYVSFDDENMA